MANWALSVQLEASALLFGKRRFSRLPFGMMVVMTVLMIMLMPVMGAGFRPAFQLTAQERSGNDFNARSRLAGADVPRYEDTEQSFDELRARVARTIVFVESFAPGQIDGSEDRAIAWRVGGRDRSFTGQPYLLAFARCHNGELVTCDQALSRHPHCHVVAKA